MPYRLVLPAALRRRGWQVKIREKERLESPHVTVLRKSDTWRIDLRSGRFLDRVPPPRLVPIMLLRFIVGRIAELRRAWDAMYPENPVGGDR